LTDQVTSGAARDQTDSARDIAVIDIGSNSVRLVQFRVEGGAVLPVYNEKVMAGLGIGVRDTGKLDRDGRLTARRAITRFQRLLDARGVSARFFVATAAVREASDGADFVADIAEQTGAVIRVLSGVEEAELSALGLVTGIPGAHGVTGDLGGSSLEFAGLDRGRMVSAVSLPLGPQEAMPEGAWNPERARTEIDSRLQAAGDLSGRGGRFYAIGGAWRALAQLAFLELDYPLHMVHEFCLPAEQVMMIASNVARRGPADLAARPGLSKRRAANLPYAALLLERIVSMGGFSDVMFSAYGLREGVLAERMAASGPVVDPLIAGAEALAAASDSAAGFSRALAAWCAPALKQLDPAFDAGRDAILVEAAARLVDIGARLHPDHRADLARESVLYAPFAGISHAERAFLAATVHFRYGGRRRDLTAQPVFQLLDKQQCLIAEMLGISLRLAAKLSGRTADLLARFEMRIDAGHVQLLVDEDVRDLYVERSVTLLTSLAKAIGRQPDIRFR
jgi:exopolyphosphatase/guanosine-5'-triphosphate,3'-diphosphate pyrophosphatase